MIEIEKKFILKPGDAEKLTAGAEPVGQKQFTDVYYDTANYALTKKDWWLRSRAGRFELKISMSPYKVRLVDQYEELEEEGAIKKALNMKAKESLSEVLPSLGYKPFATIVTVRTKYRKGAFMIDIDSVDYGHDGYDLAEIELMVGSKEEMEEAAHRIVAFAKSCGLAVGTVRGKIMEYLWRNNKEHFKALETEWGVKL